MTAGREAPAATMAPASNSTMHKVLNTTELLESILLHADTKTLLACLQVSKRLNKVIRKSPALLQHNFLAPITKASELSAQSSVTNEFVIERKILVCAQRCCWFKIHRAHNHVGKKTDSEYGVTFFHSYCSEQSRARQSWQVMLLEQPPRKIRIKHICRTCFGKQNHNIVMSAEDRLRDLGIKLFAEHGSIVHSYDE